MVASRRLQNQRVVGSVFWLFMVSSQNPTKQNGLIIPNRTVGVACWLPICLVWNIIFLSVIIPMILTQCADQAPLWQLQRSESITGYHGRKAEGAPMSVGGAACASAKNGSESTTTTAACGARKRIIDPQCCGALHAESHPSRQWEASGVTWLTMNNCCSMLCCSYHFGYVA